MNSNDEGVVGLAKLPGTQTNPWTDFLLKQNIQESPETHLHISIFLRARSWIQTKWLDSSLQKRMNIASRVPWSTPTTLVDDELICKTSLQSDIFANAMPRTCRSNLTDERLSSNPLVLEMTLISFLVIVPNLETIASLMTTCVPWRDPRKT